MRAPLAAALAALLLSASASTAAADESQTDAAALARWRAERDVQRVFVNVNLGLRFGVEDSHNESTYGQLDQYGYRGDAASKVVTVAAGYELIPFVDLGAVIEHSWHREGAVGSSDAMDTFADAGGVVVRGKIRSPSRRFEAAVRFELGGIRSSTELRQQALVRWSPYLRNRVELLIGRPTLAVTLHFTYTVVWGTDDFAPYTPPVLGGLGLGVGVMHRF